MVDMGVADEYVSDLVRDARWKPASLAEIEQQTPFVLPQAQVQ